MDWSAAAQQAGKLFTLFFVVSFGSSLDISAIQADLPMPIDYNAELQTVGATLVCTPSVRVGSHHERSSIRAVVRPPRG